jgi:DNA-binding CsgD family transcriptional regulator
MSSAISAERASQLIGLIYDCVLTPGRWVETLHAIRSDLSFHYALLSLWRIPAGTPVGRQHWFSSGLDDIWLDRLHLYGPELVEYWGGMDALQGFPLDEPGVASEFRRSFQASTNRFYEEWLKPQSIIDLVGVALVRSPDELGSIGFARHEDAGPVTEAEVAALRLLGPHFRRAVAIGNLLDMKTIEAAAFASTLEALTAGMVLVDSEARVVHANAAARAMLAVGDPIRLEEGRLQLPSSQASDALADSIARSSGNLELLGQRGISIPARMKDGRPCVAHVLPIRGGEARWGLEPRAIAAVFVAPAETAPQMPAAALALAYDVTPAETRVLELILSGLTPKEIGEKLGLSITTVRTHLARLFHKTGTSRQAELVALIGRMTLPLV